MILSHDEQDTLVGHAFREHPVEACGLILEREGHRLLLRARNVQDMMRVFAPTLPPATEAYTLDPTTLLQAGALVHQGWRIAVIYHSHTNGYPGLSDRDRAAASPGGRNLYPDTSYLVVAAHPPDRGHVAFTMAAWIWRDGEFREERIIVGDVAPTEILTSGTIAS